MKLYAITNKPCGLKFIGLISAAGVEGMSWAWPDMASFVAMEGGEGIAHPFMCKSIVVGCYRWHHQMGCAAIDIWRSGGGGIFGMDPPRPRNVLCGAVPMQPRAFVNKSKVCNPRFFSNFSGTHWRFGAAWVGGASGCPLHRPLQPQHHLRGRTLWRYANMGASINLLLDKDFQFCKIG